jgi:hypothetical protein
MPSNSRSVSLNGNKLLLIVAFVLFAVYVVGIFAGWSGNLDASLPWIAFAVWVLSALI